MLTRSPGYLAAVDAAQVDAERFRVLAVDGRRELRAGRFVPAAATLREALGLWRGDAYAEFDAPFATAERSALEELRLAAVEDRIAAELALGAGAELVGELETLVAQHPWRERLWAQLMTAPYRSGRQRDALNAFQRARTSLVDELGVEPGPALRVVEAQVLAQDVQLLGERPPSDLPPALTAVGPTFVGREAELAHLLEAYDRAASGAIERVLLIGPHGIGKTRLLAEFAREARRGVDWSAPVRAMHGRRPARRTWSCSMTCNERRPQSSQRSRSSWARPVHRCWSSAPASPTVTSPSTTR